MAIKSFQGDYCGYPNENQDFVWIYDSSGKLTARFFAGDEYFYKCEKYDQETVIKRGIIYRIAFSEDGEKLLIHGRSKEDKHDHVILIVDETSRINREDCYQIETLFHNDYFLSVLFMDKSLNDAKLSPGIKKLIGRSVYKLSSLSPAEAVELARSRLDGNKDLITNDLIKKVYAKSKKNSRLFLMNLEDVCRHAVEAGRKKVKKEDLIVL